MAGDKSQPAASAQLLSQASFAALLEFLAGGAAAAGNGNGEVDVGAAYENVRARLVKFFQYKGSLAPDDLADATLNRVARLLEAGQEVRSDEPHQYVLGVARRVHLETVKREVRAKKGLDQAPPAPDPDVAAEHERRAAALERCLDRLGREDREVILVYHQGRGQARIDRRKGLAERLGLSLNAIRIRAFRIRGQLQTCVEAALAP